MRFVFRLSLTVANRFLLIVRSGLSLPIVGGDVRLLWGNKTRREGGVGNVAEGPIPKGKGISP